MVCTNPWETTFFTQQTPGLPAYSDTGYIDIPAFDSFWSKKGSPYSENPGYSDIPLTVTLFGRPNTVTVSGEACNELIDVSGAS